MKKGSENSMDKYFYEGLENLNILPPAEVWDHIAGSLPTPKKDRRLFFWIALAASVTVFAAISGWFMYQTAGVESGKFPSVSMAKSSAIPSNSSHKDFISTGKNIPANDNKKIATTPHTAAILPVPDSKLPDNTEEEPALQVAPSNKVNSFSGNETTSNVPILTRQDIQPFGRSAFTMAEYPEYLVPRMMLIPGKNEHKNLFTAPSSVKKDTVRIYEPLYAYEEPEEAKVELDKWTIGGQIAPMYTYNHASNLKSASISKSGVSSSESPMVTFSSGLTVGLKTSSRWSVETGIAYTVASNNIQTMSGYSSSDGVMSSSNDYLEIVKSPESQTENQDQKLEYVEVPLLAKYKILDRKFNIHVLGGLSTNVLVSNKSTNNLEDFKTFNYSSSLGMGIGYMFGKNLNFNLEPTFKYYLRSFNSNAGSNVHPMAFGIYSGIYYYF